MRSHHASNQLNRGRSFRKTQRKIEIKDKQQICLRFDRDRCFFDFDFRSNYRLGSGSMAFWTPWMAKDSVYSDLSTIIIAIIMPNAPTSYLYPWHIIKRIINKSEALWHCVASHVMCTIYRIRRQSIYTAL